MSFMFCFVLFFVSQKALGTIVFCFNTWWSNNFLFIFFQPLNWRRYCCFSLLYSEPGVVVKCCFAFNITASCSVWCALCNSPALSLGLALAVVMRCVHPRLYYYFFVFVFCFVIAKIASAVIWCTSTRFAEYGFALPRPQQYHSCCSGRWNWLHVCGYFTMMSGYQSELSLWNLVIYWRIYLVSAKKQKLPQFFFFFALLFLVSHKNKKKRGKYEIWPQKLWYSVIIQCEV